MLCSHPMRRQTRQRAVVGKPGRRTARPKFGNTELSAQPTVASNGGKEHQISSMPFARVASREINQEKRNGNVPQETRRN